MKKVKCVIAEDESLSSDVLETYIAKLENYHLIARCRSGIEVFNLLKTEPVDLLFLDIEMPQLSGLELVKSMNEIPPVIFTTAFREYAVEGYELNAIDYLLKPVSFDRFLKAIDKFESGALPLRFKRYTSEDPAFISNNAFIYIKSAKKTVKVFLRDIVFIEGAKELVKIKTIHGEVYTYQTIQEFEQRLPDAAFLRIHRSFIVGIDHIRAYSATHVEVGDIELPIGHSYQRSVKNALRQ